MYLYMMTIIIKGIYEEMTTTDLPPLWLAYLGDPTDSGMVRTHCDSECVHYVMINRLLLNVIESVYAACVYPNFQ